MTQPPKKLIPVNIVAGPLGVGKTTVINHLLEHRPAGENWAVLVNEYGLVGLDAALLEKNSETNKPAVRIREVAGGCICCSAGIAFQMTLVMLLRRRPDRLLIEPTGLAAVSGILDTLDSQGIRESVDVRSIICLLDPSRLHEYLEREIVRDQVDAADIVIGARSDVSTNEQKRAFETWARDLFPAKQHICLISHGHITPTLLDLVSHAAGTAPRRGHRHGTDHTHVHHTDDAHTHDETAEQHTHESIEQCDENDPFIARIHRSPVASTVGWVCWRGCVFDAERTFVWLRKLGALPGSSRVKAVLRTSDGWQSYNAVSNVEDISPSGYRRDSRFELIVENEPLPDISGLEDELRDCLVPSE